MCETGRTKAPRRGRTCGRGSDVFTGTLDLGACGASRRDVQGKVREACVRGIGWGRASSLEMGEGTC